MVHYCGCAATIFAAVITVTDVPTMSGALIPLAGKYAGLLFAFGFLMLQFSLFVRV